MKAIVINDKEYPCYQSMGAFRIYRSVTGSEAELDLAKPSTANLIVWLWAMVKAACRKECVEFSYSLEDFEDSLEPETLQEKVTEMREETAGLSKKKKATAPRS